MLDRTKGNGESGGSGRGWLDGYMPADAGLAARVGRDMFDIRTLRGMLYRQRFLLGAAIATSLIAGLLVTLFATPVYEAEATVRVDTDGSYIVEGQNIAPAIHANEVYRYMETQGSVIRSRRLAYAVAEALDLTEDESFLGEAATGRPDGVDADGWAARKRDMAADILQSGVEAEIPAQNRIVTITYSSPDPLEAARIANAYAEVYVREDTRRSFEDNQYALEYLGTQIAETRERLQEAELAANAYARDSGIVNQSVAGGTDILDEAGAQQSITGANLARINGTFADARARRIAAEQRWRAISALPAVQLPEVQNNNTVQSVLAERARLEGELAEMRQRYDETYPVIADLKAQIAALDNQFATIAGNIKNSVRNEYRIALRQERALSGELQRLSRATLDEQDRRVRFELLEREAIALRQQLASLLERYNEINSAANLQVGTLSLLDRATVPTAPVSPNLLTNLLLALMGGIAIAAVVVVVREAIDDSMRSIEDIEDRLGHTVLGQTPFVLQSELDEQLDNAFSPLREAYASLQSTLDYAIPRSRNVLQVTSSQAGEGKSTTALVLARKSAQLGRRTLLIDADLRRPALAHMLGAFQPETGFVEVLLGHADLASAMLPDTPDNLDVVPIGKLPPNPVELLSSRLVEEFVEKHRDEYSMIIFDSSPVMGIADAPILASQVDATIFVVEANNVHYGQVRDALRRIEATGGDTVGIVLSKFRAQDAGQSYDYHYRYYEYRTAEPA